MAVKNRQQKSSQAQNTRRVLKQKAISPGNNVFFGTEDLDLHNDRPCSGDYAACVPRRTPGAPVRMLRTVMETRPLVRSSLRLAAVLALASGSLLGLSACAARGGGQAADPQVASARDRVFPALVNIRVVTVSYFGGQETKGGGTGSGTIISPDGYVLTNAHVTGDGVRFFCILADKQEISATMVGEDPLTDLAVLKLNLSELKPGTTLSVAGFGDSDTLAIGDPVLAMGSPFSLSRSVTLGIVSNTSRVFTSGFGSEELDEMELDYGQSTGSLTNWIQHDALINPGNSGGPLVNLRGEIIGVNTRGGSGMGFASPSNLARSVADQIIANGEVVRSTVGLAFKAISKTGLSRGVLVNTVNKDGPAARVGIEPGDVIIAIDGEPLTVRFAEEIPPLLRKISSKPVGSELRFTIDRKGSTLDLALKTEKLLREKGDETLLRTWGISAMEITEAIARSRRLPSREGALITGVRSGSPPDLSEPKLQFGDIIRSIDGRPVRSVKELSDVYQTIMRVEKPEDIPEFVLIEVDRNGKNQVTVIKPRPPKKEDQPQELPKAWLAVETQPVFRDLARKLSAEATPGFRVTRVYPNTLAAGSDLRPGDLIVAVGDEKMSPRGMQDAGQLQRKIRSFRPDDKVSIRVMRGGEPVNVEVTLERTRITASEARTDENKDFDFSVREITFFDRDEQRWDENVQGVIVTNVERVGWAGLAGLSFGDLIQRVNDREIRGIDDFRTVMADLAKTQPTRVIFAVLRDNRSTFLFAEPDWKPAIKQD